LTNDEGPTVVISFSALQETTWLKIHQAMQYRHEMLQDVSFARMSQGKYDRSQVLSRSFADRVDIRIFITDTPFKHIRLGEPNFCTQQSLPLRRILEGDRSEVLPDLNGAIVVLNNADIDSDSRMEAYSRLYNDHPNTIFIGWDTDNHHTLQVSMAMATLVDFYVQTQMENIYDLSRFNPIHAFVPTGLVAISRKNALRLFSEMLVAERSDETQGYFGLHQPFHWRNQVVSTLARAHPNLGFFNENRGPYSVDDYPRVLIKNKLHWIVPTLNDVSARVHDIFVTGGIPLVPHSLKFHPALAGVSASDIVFYTLNDIIDSRNCIKEGLEKFNSEGAVGMRRRFKQSMANHADINLARILGLASEHFGFEFL